MRLVEQARYDNKFYYKYELISEQEYMLTNVVNRLLNIDNFVIDYSHDQLQFNIKGYYFSIDSKEITELYDKDVYAYIDDSIIDDGNIESYGCVQLVISDNCDCILNKSKLLHVLHKDIDNWHICNDSKFKININMNSVDSFEDGEIV